MALDDDIRAFERAPLLGEIGRDALRLLAFSADTRSLRAGGVLFRKGETALGGFVLVQGTLSLSAGEGAPERIVNRGALLGELALIVEIEQSDTATATEPSRVLSIPRSSFRRILEEFPDVTWRFRARLAERLRADQRQLASILADLSGLDALDAGKKDP